MRVGHGDAANASPRYRTTSIAVATRKTIRNPTPEIPSQPKSGLSGLSDCDSPPTPREAAVGPHGRPGLAGGPQSGDHRRKQPEPACGSLAMPWAPSGTPA